MNNDKKLNEVTLLTEYKVSRFIVVEFIQYIFSLYLPKKRVIYNGEPVATPALFQPFQSKDYSVGKEGSPKLGVKEPILEVTLITELNPSRFKIVEKIQHLLKFYPSKGRTTIYNGEPISGPVSLKTYYARDLSLRRLRPKADKVI